MIGRRSSRPEPAAIAPRLPGFGVARQLQYDSDRKSYVRIPAVVKVVPVVIIDVDVIGAVPVFLPVFRPGIQEQERIAAIQEARIPHVHGGAVVQPEIVLTPEGETEGGLRNVVAAVAATLQPVAMLAVPLLSATLLPCAIPLVAALPCPSPLLLPRDCLLPRTLRLLLLPGLLGTLCLLLPLLLLRLLDPPLLLRLSLSALSLRSGRALLAFACSAALQLCPVLRLCWSRCAYAGTIVPISRIRAAVLVA